VIDPHGGHIVELIIVEQPASPMTYTVSEVQPQMPDCGDPLMPGASCVSVPTSSLPSQTVTLATPERLVIPFAL
jgi:hypothetical protein